MGLSSYKSRPEEAVRLGIATCAAILHAEGECRPAVARDPEGGERTLKEWEGAIWVPTITTSDGA